MRVREAFEHPAVQLAVSLLKSLLDKIVSDVIRDGVAIVDAVGNGLAKFAVLVNFLLKKSLSRNMNQTVDACNSCSLSLLA